MCRVSGIHCAGSSCAHEGKKAKSTLFAFRVLPSVWQSQLCCLSRGSWPSGVEEQKIQTQQLQLCWSNWVLSSKPFSEKNYDRYIWVPIAAGNQITTPSSNMFVVPLFPSSLNFSRTFSCWFLLFLPPFYPQIRASPQTEKWWLLRTTASETQMRCSTIAASSPIVGDCFDT